MSHQTGIRASDGLRSAFATCNDGDVRLMKIGIIDEKLELLESVSIGGTWEDDWDSYLVPRLEEKQPCFIIYRLDERSETGFLWVYLAYSPDFSPVKQKMLYAATRATLKSEFGGGQIKDEVFGTVLDDVSLTGYKKHVTAQDAPAPLTFAEEELQAIKKNESDADIGIDTKHQTIQGVSFPISQDAFDHLLEFKAGNINYVQLCLDLQKERILLDQSGSISVSDLSGKVPTDHARYHFFNFSHTHEGDFMQTPVFIYSMPGYKCSIRERMLYSSCKSPLIDIVEQKIGLEIAKKIETDDAKELTEEFIYDEVHPKKNVARQQFARPKGPAGRGPRRMTKPT